MAASRGAALLLGLAVLGRASCGPVTVQPSEAQPSSDQVLRRVADWLDRLDSLHVDGHQRPLGILGYIEDHMERMRQLEISVLKLDFKLDRLEEVMIRRDIKQDNRNAAMAAQLARMSAQLVQLDAHVDAMHSTLQEEPAESEAEDAIPLSDFGADAERPDDWASAEYPSDEEHADRTAGVVPGGSRSDRGQGSDSTVREVAGGRHMDQAGRAEAATATLGESQDRATDAGLWTPGDGRDGATHPIISQAESVAQSEALLSLMEQLRGQITRLDGQLTGGISSIDDHFQDRLHQHELNLAEVSAAVRDEFFDVDDSLRQITELLSSLRTAAGEEATASQRHLLEIRDTLRIMLGTLHQILLKMELEVDRRYEMSTRLDGDRTREKMTTQINRLETATDRGFSKLYAQLTRLAQDLREALLPPGGECSRLGEQVDTFFGTISRRLHDIELRLAAQDEA